MSLPLRCYVPAGYAHLMADWRMQSPAQRRRAGAPTNHLDGAWSAPSSGRNSVADDMSAALGAEAQNLRVPMGRDALADIANRSAENHARLLMAKGNTQAQDPGLFPTDVRSAVMISEPAGARYGIRVNTAAPIMPEAGPTTANGRIIPSRNSSPGGFQGGAMDAAL